MKVDTQPFASVNMVEGYDRSARRQLDFALGINMAGLAPRHRIKNEEADPCDRPQKGEKGYITEEQVRHVRNQWPASSDLLKKYKYQYQQRLQRESEEEEYERRIGKCLKKWEDMRDHWHCPFFKYCWDSSMSRLATTKDCPECGSQKRDVEGVSVFRCWDLCRPSMSRFSHHAEGWTLKRRRISIIGRAGLLMDLTVPRNAGYSGCAI
jgi:hypothetical protein